MELVERCTEAGRRLEVPEPQHRVVPLFQRPMRLFGPVVQIAITPMDCPATTDPADRLRIRPMMISCDVQGPVARHLNETSQEASGGRPIAVLAQHRVEQLPIAIDRPVQVAPAPGDLHIRLVQIPRAAGASGSASAELIADQRREAELPGADRLVRNVVAALQQQFGDIAQPELVAEASEYGEQHDVRWKLQFVERGTGAFVEASLAAGA